MPAPVTIGSTMRLLKRSVIFFVKHPILFLLLQIPETSVEILEDLIGPKTENRMFLILFVAIPYFFFTSFLTTTLTFVAISKLETGGPFSIKDCLKAVGGKMKIIFPVSMVTGLILGLSLAAIILPFFYFMTIYLFVPFLVMQLPSSPWASYLYQSKKMVRPIFWQTFFMVVIMILLSTVLQIGLNVDAFTHWGDALDWAVQPTRYFLSAVLGAIVTIWMSLYYLKVTSP